MHELGLGVPFGPAFVRPFRLPVASSLNIMRTLAWRVTRQIISVWFGAP
jgi:hypothetical protein